MDAASLTAATIDDVAVESIRPGDRIVLPMLGEHVVSSVTVDDAGEVRVVYFGDEVGYENRARAAKGASHLGRLVEKGIKPHRVGDLIPCRRGARRDADELRKTMLRRQAERWARLEL